MTSWRGVGHLGATALGLALLSWPGALISAGDVSADPSGDIAASLRTLESPSLEVGATPRGWGRRNPEREANPFLDGHLLPRLHRQARRMKVDQEPDERRIEQFGRDMGRATERAVTGYLEDVTLVPMRDRLDKLLERAAERRSRTSRAQAPPLGATATGAERRDRGTSTAGTRADRKRGDFDVDLGFSSGAPELRLEYKAGGLDLDFGLGEGGPELSLKLGPGGRRLRLDVRGDGEVGLVFRPMKRSTVKARLDPGSDRYYTSFVHRF